MEEFEIRVYWREVSFDEENGLRTIEVDVANYPGGVYQAAVPDTFTQKAKSTLEIWEALGAPAGATVVNVTAAKAAAK